MILTPCVLPGPPLVLALDLGSVHCGAVLAPAALPIAPAIHPLTITVDGCDLDGAVAAIGALLDEHDVRRVVVEHGPYYVSPTASDAAKAAQAKAHAVCERLLERIKIECRARGIPGQRIPRATWAHRVVPHTRGGITTKMAMDGLRVHVTEEGWEALNDQHQRDAAGALVGVLLPAPVRIYRRRARDNTDRPMVLLGKEERRRRALASWRTSKRKARGSLDRLAGTTCNCGPDGAPKVGAGRHKSTCPSAPPTRPTGPRGMSDKNIASAINVLQSMFGN